MTTKEKWSEPVQYIKPMYPDHKKFTDPLEKWPDKNVTLMLITFGVLVFIVGIIILAQVGCTAATCTI